LYLYLFIVIVIVIVIIHFGLGTRGHDLIVGELACHVDEGIHEPGLQKALVVPAEALVNVELDLCIGCVLVVVVLLVV
jgi:hypothetical protein